MLATGLRIGEAAAVRPQDVDLEARIVWVTGNLVRLKGGGVVRQETESSKLNPRGLELPVCDKVQFVIGMGVAGEVAGHQIHIGSERFLRSLGISTRKAGAYRPAKGARDVTELISEDRDAR